MSVFAKFPESKLIDVLSEKVEAQDKKYSALSSEVCKFQEHIVPELRQINELFKEYTPHDENYHISHLFRIADIFLGEEKYQKMNTVELFLLVIAMYAHDWGMAVSESERNYITTKNKPEGSLDIPLLDDEHSRFEQFIKKRMGQTEFDNHEQIDINIWQDYIRETHAIRSGKRVYSYFVNYNSGVAAALEKICKGHWLEIEEISDHNGYYKDTSVLGETVNLKALSAYIRLIDLFDLAEDRTPYVLWKYVNPQNEYSKMEWAKHRALHQITCPSYERGGRVLCISGSTDNHEVYAALMDFKKLCEKYFRECIDMIAHMNDPRHELGVHLMEWRIEPRNFKPIDISFSFNKEHIFKILGDEIYNCHPYVYIRELLQNSIDAITLRKGILDRKRVGGDNVGYIHFNVQWEKEDTLVVACTDDGVGMDEYILKNYFSVLGKSYYTSDDFKKTEIDINPISKFGIGILSCFSVASRMEITTKREPYMGEGREGLKVIIDDLKKTFRVEEIPEYGCEVGSTIKLYIKKSTLEEQLAKRRDSIEDYKITEYIKYIAHYVKYPIIVHEHERKIVLLPHGYNRGRIERIITDMDKYDVLESDDEYPIDDIVFMQDRSKFQDVFDIRTIDIHKHLGIEEAEGTIHFVILRNHLDDIESGSPHPSTTQILVNKKTRIRWGNNKSITPDERARQRYTKDKQIMIYNKGILIEDDREYPLPYNRFRSRTFPNPYIKINFPDTIAEMSVSRFNVGNRNNLIENLWTKLTAFISAEFTREKILKMEPYAFWRKLAVYVMQYHLNISALDMTLFTDVSFPFIDSNGDLLHEKIDGFDRIALIPQKKRNIMGQYCLTGQCEKEEKWEYGKCLLALESSPNYVDSIAGEICPIIFHVLNRNYFLKEIKFIKDDNFNIPIEQQIFERGDENYIVKELASILSSFGVSYEKDSEHIDRLYHPNWGDIVEFSGEYSHCFSYGGEKYNICNEKMRRLIIYRWLFYKLSEGSMCNEIEIRNKEDELECVPFWTTGFSYDGTEYSFSKINATLKDLHIWLKALYPNLEGDTVSLSKEDFVDGSIEMTSDDTFHFNLDILPIDL